MPIAAESGSPRKRVPTRGKKVLLHLFAPGRAVKNGSLLRPGHPRDRSFCDGMVRPFLRPDQAPAACYNEPGLNSGSLLVFEERNVCFGRA
jgi:hypothetical protein